MPVFVAILIGIGSFLFGGAAIVGLLYFSSRKAKKRSNRHAKPSGKSNDADAQKEKTKKKGLFERFGVMNFILLVIAVTLLVFVITMIELFRQYGTVPDTLIVSVFAVCGTECGAMSWIKTNKDKQQQRKWDLEDEERMEKRIRKEEKDSHRDDE